MADEEEVWTGQVENWGYEGQENADPTALYDPSMHYINPKSYSRWPLDRFVQAAHDGELELLAKMLDRENPIDGYHGDINVHCPTLNALHMAAVNGQLEAVELLLGAGADPHVRASVPYGKDPKEGETARDLAEKWGWDDIVDVLKRAEIDTPKGVYRTYGTGNNAKLWPIDKPMGLDPAQERRAVKKYKGMVRPVPGKADRKFYGDAVYGITHGHDEQGNVIRGRKETLAVQQAGRSDLEAGEPWVVGQSEAPPPQSSANVGLFFPGMGSQYVGMMSEVKTKPGVQRMLRLASEILNFDLMEVCVNGPESKLEQPQVLLPAMYVASLAGVERLREQRPDVAERPGGLAGLGIGEFAALTVAGVWSFRTGLDLVKAYGEAIAECVVSSEQASLSVAGLDKAKLQEFCEQAKTSAGGGVCQIAQELFPKGFTCGGTLKLVEALKAAAESGGALQCKILRTFGAIHTPLMEPVRAVMEQRLKALLPTMRPPRCDVYMNTTGKAVRKGTAPSELLAPLLGQVTSALLWERSVTGMITMGIDEFYEVGPQKQLKAMMKRIDPTVWGRTKNIEI
mmetsp:Transcript_59104/g.183511  ORF Transcript_59104/g.183511 Transcript_59104/m.183511 type:complete len:569 (-) Transcript_59104:43-1749(-)|eukprot:CAMPEP_0204598256 /NCGR_PEP_ID=MMETSP0661-20131031/54221_1 /ASSEMBLY_ACC=CAM_ASM_000606 /TAXON_ID=109239 /ORGANISM="Alexandrium margalefi, Strain AMGDE01CS-322" /LENGTH=568 /DNA_ID=CAMNT_0051608959 /DNA_START=41 /DNA_END=1747 /DNA_ORIENTATION=-